jgi:hypothetical protein
MSEEKEQLTPEQIEDNRKKVIQYYKKQAEVLEHQAKYENLLADIETARARRMEMIIRQAQMAAGPQDEKSEESMRDNVAPQEEAPLEEKKERKLKGK